MKNFEKQWISLGYRLLFLLISYTQISNPSIKSLFYLHFSLSKCFYISISKIFSLSNSSLSIQSSINPVLSQCHGFIVAEDNEVCPFEDN